MADVFISHLEWTGAATGPTRDPATFSRDLNVSMGAITLPMSSAPGYRGDPSRANPEQLFVASLSAGHARTYLFLAAKNQIPVIGDRDEAEGHRGAAEARARALLAKAHESGVIASSVATPVDVVPVFAFVEAAAAR